MTSENGNGELRQLLQIKHAYRKGLTSLEEELKTQFERDLADGKKRLKEQYLENVVDTVFAESAKPVVAVPSAPAEPAPPACPECGGTVGPSDKFCANCAYPLQEDVKDNVPVVSTGRRLRTRVRR